MYQEVLTCTSVASPAPAPRRDEAFLFSNCATSRQTLSQTLSRLNGTECTWNGKYPFEKVSGFLCEVGRQVEFTLEDLVDGLFAVFSGERRLWGGKRLQKVLHRGRELLVQLY